MPAYDSYPYAFFEGREVPIEEAKLSIMTNSLNYGGGVYGGIKAIETGNGMAVFRLKDHLKRLKDSVTVLGFPFELDTAKTEEIILKLARKNQVRGTTYIRPLVYRSDTMLAPDIEGEYSLAIYMVHMPEYFDPSKGLDVCVSSWQRNSENTIPPRTKATGGYINSALAINEAHKKGFDSAIMLDKNGHVSEGAVMNIFLVKNSKLITPSPQSDILEGIVRKTVLEMAAEMNIEVEERIVDKDELYTAEEVFFTGTAANITWCKTIDKRLISEKAGPLTAEFIKGFADLPKTHPQYFTSV